jgi:hypothetical protein
MLKGSGRGGRADVLYEYTVIHCEMSPFLRVGAWKTRRKRRLQGVQEYETQTYYTVSPEGHLQQ